MDKISPSSLFAALDSLLQHEKHALLHGNFADLADIHEEKARLLNALEMLSPEEQAPLQNLHQAVTRNQSLLENALSGIRDVAERMATLRHVQHTLQTYDAQGQKSDIYLANPRKLEKRA